MNQFATHTIPMLRVAKKKLCKHQHTRNTMLYNKKIVEPVYSRSVTIVYFTPLLILNIIPSPSLSSPPNPKREDIVMFCILPFSV